MIRSGKRRMNGERAKTSGYRFSRISSPIAISSSRCELEGLLTDQLLAEPAGELVDGEDGDEEQEDQRQRLGAEATRNRKLQLRADTAAADGADDGGGAHVDLQTKERVGGEVGQHLGQRGEAHPADPIAADGAQALV